MIIPRISGYTPASYNTPTRQAKAQTQSFGINISPKLRKILEQSAMVGDFHRDNDDVRSNTVNKAIQQIKHFYPKSTYTIGIARNGDILLYNPENNSSEKTKLTYLDFSTPLFNTWKLAKMMNNLRKWRIPDNQNEDIGALIPMWDEITGNPIHSK